MNLLTFQRPGGGHLQLTVAAVASMRAHVQRRWWAREAGGVLLGRLLIEGERVVVDEVTVPGPDDRRSRFRFFRAERPAQAAVDEAWARSGGVLNYLGEWHTHPEDDPTPSWHDRTDWRRLVKVQTYEQPALFFVIVGRERIRAWEFCRVGGRPVALASLTDQLHDGYDDAIPPRGEGST